MKMRREETGLRRSKKQGLSSPASHFSLEKNANTIKYTLARLNWQRNNFMWQRKTKNWALHDELVMARGPQARG